MAAPAHDRPPALPHAPAAAVGVLLAAGASTRLPPDKLALPLGGRTVLEGALATLAGAPGVADVVVVLPPGGAARWARLAAAHVHLVENPQPAAGMIGSIRVGLSHPAAQGRDFLLLPADTPCVPAALAGSLLARLRAGGHAAVLPTYAGQGGHPGAFAAALAADFQRLGAREGAREVLALHRARVLRLPVDEPAVAFDLDTPEDLPAAGDPALRRQRVEGRGPGTR
ncbi:MAG: NTP transferase domain-containing protein [Planctomycetia bacterium]